MRKKTSKTIVVGFITLLVGLGVGKFLVTPIEPWISVADSAIKQSVHIKVDGVSTINFFGTKLGPYPVKVRGSGVFISSKGHVLTCAHLFWLNSISTVTVCNSNDVCTSAEVLNKDDKRDLALLKTGFKHIIPARLSKSLTVGQEVLAVGSPLGFPFSVSHGMISALNRDEIGYNMTQSDTFLNPGNSGGGLFNIKGELVGINSRIVPPVPAPIFTGLGFSVSPDQIREFLSKFKGI